MQLRTLSQWGARFAFLQFCFVLPALAVPTPDLLTPEERSYITKHGPIRYAPDPGFAPFEFFDEKGKMQGITPDILHLIEEKLQISFEPIRYPNWSEVLKGIKNAEVDMLGTLTLTEERQAFLHFTDAYLSIPYVLFARGELQEVIKSLEDMSTYRLGVVRDYGINDWLKKNYSFLKVIPVEDVRSGLSMVSTGQLDALLETLPVGVHVLQQLSLGNIRMIPKQIYVTSQYMAVLKNKPVLRNILNKGLRSLTVADRASIFVRWTGLDFTKLGVSSWYRNLAWGLLILILILAVWGMTLRKAVAIQTRELRKSESLYRNLFEAVPVVLWEEDFSEVKKLLDELHQQGVVQGINDWQDYFRKHPEVVLQCAERAKIFNVNTTALEVFGASTKAELLGNLNKVFVPESMPGFTQLLTSLLNGDYPAKAEGFNRSLSGELKWVDARGSVVSGAEKDWSRIIVSTVDLSERKKAEEEKVKLLEQLRQSQKLEAIGTLAGGVAHDFNNILAAIIGYAELALMRIKAGQALSNELEGIMTAALRARSVVQQILTFSRKANHEKRQINLVEVVNEATQLMRAMLPASIELKTHFEMSDARVLADATQMHQVIMNLCANAQHSMKESGGCIEISLDRQGAFVRLRVSDTGVGMDENTRQRIFEPYFTTKKQGEGSGLGLAVAHGIVASHGGSISVQSALGRGSVFTVLIPAVLSPSGREKAERDSSLNLGHSVELPRGTGRILFVDDEASLVEVGKQQLEALGYEVLACTSTEEALKIFKKAPQQFDLVITDQALPKMTGADLTRELKKVRPEIPVVICTGFSAKLDSQTAQEIGAAAFLLKPVDLRELAKVVNQVLKKGKA